MGNRRALDESDVSDFLDASTERPEKPKLSKTQRAAFIDYLMQHYPARMRSIRRDLRWLHKKALKQGIDPEEVRWMLW